MILTYFSQANPLTPQSPLKASTPVVASVVCLAPPKDCARRDVPDVSSCLSNRTAVRNFARPCGRGTELTSRAPRGSSAPYRGIRATESTAPAQGGPSLCDAKNAGDGGSANASVQDMDPTSERGNESNASDLPCWVSTDAIGRVATCDSNPFDERRQHRDSPLRETDEQFRTPTAPRHHLTLNVSALPNLHVTEFTNIFVRGKGTQVPTMAQRDSEPQLIATTLDELTSDVTRKLGEDGLLDECDMRIIRGLKVLTFRQARQAEVFDLTTSINRVGFTPRNIRRLRDMNPDAFGPECA